MVATHNYLLHGGVVLPEVDALRHASRELVRELGFLRGYNASTELSHSHTHTLIEVGKQPRILQGALAAILRLDKSTTSRIVAELEERGLLRVRPSAGDRRARELTLSAKGREKLTVVHRDASARVEQALLTLSDEERAVVVRGMELYAGALERSRRRALHTIRPIEPRDREGVARLIRTVMPEFGACGPGFAINDPEVDDMPATYKGRRARYFVVTRDDEVLGGGGFAPLAGGDTDTCELRKMYFHRELRGLGLGQELLVRCIAGARKAGFTTMYLETLKTMTAARALYERNGFVARPEPLGATGHFRCDAFYSRSL